jgi:RNA polymerase sigma-70 factor (ECF subfamily)
MAARADAAGVPPQLGAARTGATLRDDASDGVEGAIGDTSETDARLVERVRAGDGKAFDRLVRRHLRAAHAVAASVVGHAQDAEDVCQDAFIKALENIDRCERPDRFRAWLLTIVRNRAHNVRDYEKLRRTQSLEVVGGTAGGDNPARNAANSELRERVNAAIETLTETQREVVILHDYEGWSHAEIGSKLEISAGASRFHLHVARRALRGQLGELHGRYED